METIAKSGLYVPNKIARRALNALEDVTGTNGLKVLLNLAGLSALIENPVPDDFERAFDFSDLSALNEALEQTYGATGARGLANRAGRHIFKHGLARFGPLAAVESEQFKTLPLATKLKIGLPVMAKIFSTQSDMATVVTEFDDHFIYSIQACPICHGRQSEKPCCHMALGLLTESLHWISGGLDFKVSEVACIAAGASSCDFYVPKEPVD